MRHVRANGAKRRRRRARRVNATPKRRRRARVNSTTRRRRRRVRRNPGSGVYARTHAMTATVASKPRRKKRRSKKQIAAAKKLGRLARRRARRGKPARLRRRRSSLWRQVRTYRKRALKTRKRTLRRSTAMAQYHRAAALRKVISRRGPKAGRRSALAKAMHLRANPGLAGFLTAGKVILPQVGAGAVSLIGASWAGRTVAKMITESNGAPRAFFAPGGSGEKLSPFVPALSTAGVAAAGYLLADKFAPKFKGAVVIGGLLGAVIQAIVAAAKPGEPDSLMSKAKAALLGDYTLVGDYTMVGGRAYAEGGMFREVGDYTLVGGADDGTQFAADSLRGMDDATEFAPGEGGVLSGGIFR